MLFGLLLKPHAAAVKCRHMARHFHVIKPWSRTMENAIPVTSPSSD